MKIVKKDKNSSLSSPTPPVIVPQQQVVDEQMTRDMADIFEKREDPLWKERQRVQRNRMENLDKSELGL